MLRTCSAAAFNEHMEVTSNLQPNWFLNDGWKAGDSVTVKCVMLWDGNELELVDGLQKG